MGQFSRQQFFPQKLSEVVGYYTNSDTTREKLEALGSRNINLKTVKWQQENLQREIERELPAEPPKVIKKFIKPWNFIVQKENWTKKDQNNHSCLLDVKIKGVPVQIKSELSFTAQKKGCLGIINTKVNCSIPLLGKYVEDYILNDAITYVEREFSFVKESLATLTS